MDSIHNCADKPECLATWPKTPSGFKCWVASTSPCNLQYAVVGSRRLCTHQQEFLVSLVVGQHTLLRWRTSCGEKWFAMLDTYGETVKSATRRPETSINPKSLALPQKRLHQYLRWPTRLRPGWFHGKCDECTTCTPKIPSVFPFACKTSTRVKKLLRDKQIVLARMVEPAWPTTLNPLQKRMTSQRSHEQWDSSSWRPSLRTLQHYSFRRPNAPL